MCYSPYLEKYLVYQNRSRRIVKYLLETSVLLMETENEKEACRILKGEERTAVSNLKK